MVPAKIRTLVERGRFAMARVAWTAALVLLVSLVFPTFEAGAQQAPAEVERVFTVSDVAVDETAETTALARERAFAVGQRAAVVQLYEHLGVGPEAPDPAGLSDADLARITQGFQVQEERTAPGRYIAVLSFTFLPDEVRGLLRTSGVGFVDTVSEPVLIVPVFRDGLVTRLWDSPNPWLDAWLDYSDRGRLVPVAVPFGDVQDLTDLSVDAALAGDRVAIRSIADRYGATDAAVVIAEPAPAGVSVVINRYSAAGDTTAILSAETPPDGSDGYAAAVASVADWLEEDWRNRARSVAAPQPVPGFDPLSQPAGLPAAAPTAAPTATPLPGVGGTPVLIRLNGQRDWIQIRDRLSRVPGLTGLTILSLSPTEAVVQLQAGSTDQLRIALQQQGLTLMQGAAGLELRRAF